MKERDDDTEWFKKEKKVLDLRIKSLKTLVDSVEKILKEFLKDIEKKMNQDEINALF